MRQTHSRSPFLRSDVRAAWRELLQRETDAARAIDLHRRERDLFPRFTEHYHRLHSLPRRWRRTIGSRLRRSLAGVALLLALAQGAAFAATITVDGTTCTLADAISAANTDTATGGCPAGSGPDVLTLVPNDTITLTSELPVIESEIVIEGKGATIERSSASGTPDFSVLTVGISGELTLSEATISGGFGDLYLLAAGGISNRGKLSLRECTISNNVGPGIYNVGGIYSGLTGSVLNITDCSVSGNTQEGIINFPDSSAYIDRTRIFNNYYGGIFNTGKMKVTNTTISGSELGAGILEGDGGSGLQIENSTVSGNKVGIKVRPEGIAEIRNSTISGNGFEESPWLFESESAGIYNYGGSVEISESTISGNYAGIVSYSYGEYGSRCYDSSTSISRSIISGNRGPDLNAVVGGSCTTDDLWFELDASNLFGDGSKTNAEAFAGAISILTPGPTDITATKDGTNPTALGSILDVTLRDNGGPTETLALVQESPAIDTGRPDCPPPETDQRGVPRPLGMACDIGAFEFGNSGPMTVSIDYKPNDSMNWTGVNGTGQVAVAIFGSNEFQVSNILPASLRFGQGYAEPANSVTQLNDRNSDGHLDLLARFRIPEIQVNCAQQEIMLRGSTSSGDLFTGTDTIRPKGCKTGLMNFKPLDPANQINPSSEGLIGVLMFSTQKWRGEVANIKAPSILIDSIRMGPNLAQTGGLPPRIADFDGDGDEDLLIRFRIPELGLNCGDTEIKLGGRTGNGRAFGATDWVQVVACK